MIRTSSFVNDVMFLHNGANPLRQVAVLGHLGAKSAVFDCVLFIVVNAINICDSDFLLAT